MALAVANALEQKHLSVGPSAARVARVLLLFPFLEVDRTSWRQWTLKTLSKAPSMLGACAAAVALLPDSWKRRVVLTYAGVWRWHSMETTSIGKLHTVHKLSSVPQELHLSWAQEG